MTPPRPSLAYVYREIDLPYVQVIDEMQSAGVLIDVDRLTSVSSQCRTRMAELEVWLHEVRGVKWSINSPMQMAVFLYDELGLPLPVKRGKDRSTDKEELERLRGLHLVVDWVDEYRRLAKLDSTYAGKIPKCVSVDGRLRCRFNNTLVETGRLSSSSPVNLQNIPKRIPKTVPPFVAQMIKEIRRAFIARPGYVIVKFDQAAVEWRVWGCLSNEQSIINAILNGLDPHVESVAVYLARPYPDVYAEYKAGDPLLKKYRDVFKNVNYGILYQQGEGSTLEYLKANGFDATMEMAQSVRAAVMGSKPDGMRWIRETQEKCRELGYVESYFGRRMYYPDVRDSRRWVREKALRESTNSPIQATSADVMKIAQTQIKRARDASMEPWATQILAVHDESVFEVREDAVDNLRAIIEEIAPVVVPEFPIRLDVEVGVGANWGDAE